MPADTMQPTFGLARVARLTGVIVSISAACDRAPTPAADKAAVTDKAPASGAAPAAATAPPSVDPELAQLQATTPVDACALVSPETLAKVFDGLKFEVHETLAPRMSGYVWDSRCVFWAGVGTLDFAKDVPTHTVDVFVATTVSPAKAQANHSARQQSAATTPGYQAKPELGEAAYATTATGLASLFFVKGASQVQINVSNLDTPNEQKIARAVALAKLL